MLHDDIYIDRHTRCHLLHIEITEKLLPYKPRLFLLWFYMLTCKFIRRSAPKSNKNKPNKGTSKQKWEVSSIHWMTVLTWMNPDTKQWLQNNVQQILNCKPHFQRSRAFLYQKKSLKKSFSVSLLTNFIVFRRHLNTVQKTSSGRFCFKQIN